MTAVEIICLAAALAMDAFSVSVSGGMSGYFSVRGAAAMTAAFGLFQFTMPLIGNGAALLFAEYTAGFGPLITFAVLLFLGVRMVLAAFSGGGAPEGNPFSPASVFLLAFATSIDALAAGISIGAAGAPVAGAAAVIGAVAALFSAAGLCIGRITRRVLPFPAEAVGGAVLIILALKSLLEFLI